MIVAPKCICGLKFEEHAMNPATGEVTNLRECKKYVPVSRPRCIHCGKPLSQYAVRNGDKWHAHCINKRSGAVESKMMLCVPGGNRLPNLVRF